MVSSLPSSEDLDSFYAFNTPRSPNPSTPKIPKSPYQYIDPCIGLEQQTVFINNRVADFDCAIGEREFVIGAGARSSVGPIARNIDGHRVAAERITAAITERMPSVQ